MEDVGPRMRSARNETDLLSLLDPPGAIMVPVESTPPSPPSTSLPAALEVVEAALRLIWLLVLRMDAFGTALGEYLIREFPVDMTSPKSPLAGNSRRSPDKGHRCCGLRERKSLAAGICSDPAAGSWPPQLTTTRL